MVVASDKEVKDGRKEKKGRRMGIGVRGWETKGHFSWPSQSHFFFSFLLIRKLSEAQMTNVNLKKN